MTFADTGTTEVSRPAVVMITLDPRIYGAAWSAGEVAQYVAHATFREYLHLAGCQPGHNLIARDTARDILREVRDVSDRRVRQILTSGEDSYWHSDTPERLRLVSLTKIGFRLGVTPLLGHQRVPIENVRTRAGMTATAVNLSLPIDDPRPMTRARKADVSGVSERHQRRIDRTELGSRLEEEVYATFAGQVDDGVGSFTDYAGHRQRRIADIRTSDDHTPAARSRVSNARRRMIRLGTPPTFRAVTATSQTDTDHSSQPRVFKDRRYIRAHRAWKRAGCPRAILAWRERGRWKRELVQDPRAHFR